MHKDCQNQVRCNQLVWMRQATALECAESSPYHSHYYNRDIHLTPQYRVHFFDKRNLIKLFSTLCTRAQLYPRGVNVCIDQILRSFLSRMLAERLALDSRSNLSLPAEGAKCTSVINCFLEDVVSLRLECDNYGYIGLVVSMIKAAIAKGQASNLKHLICSVPNLYMDIIGPLCALFSLQNFHLLMLDVSEVCSLTLSKLLHVFVTAPCSHTQKLIIYFKEFEDHPSLLFQLALDENQVASLDMKDVRIPFCSLQHKVLRFSSTYTLTTGLYLLLQFPTIRLKELTLFTTCRNFHLCAVHPDLKMTKLVVTIDGPNPHYQDALQQDIVSLFGIMSLQKIRILGVWGRWTEAKLGLVFGLRGRSQLQPLKKLTLELWIEYYYDIQDFEMLCDAIFSLPQLENLKLVLGKGFGDLISKKSYEDALYECWIKRAAGKKLESIFLQTYKTELKLVSLVTRNLSFSLLPYDYYDDYDPSDDRDYDGCSDDS